MCKAKVAVGPYVWNRTENIPPGIRLGEIARGCRESLWRQSYGWAFHRMLSLKYDDGHRAVVACADDGGSVRRRICLHHREVWHSTIECRSASDRGSQ